MLKLVKPSAEYTKQIAEYRAEFPVERERVTYDPSRIPGTDYLESYDNVLDWLAFCESMADKLTWHRPSVKVTADLSASLCFVTSSNTMMTI